MDHCGEVFVGTDVAKARNAVSVADGGRGLGTFRRRGRCIGREHATRALATLRDNRRLLIGRPRAPAAGASKNLNPLRRALDLRYMFML
jgi:hypothetical protein